MKLLKFLPSTGIPRLLLAIFSLLLIEVAFEAALGSGSAFAKTFEIITTPEGAEVFIELQKGKGEIKLGNTPLKLPSKEVFSQSGADKTFMLKISKDGFDPYRVMMVKNPGVEYKMEVLLETSKEIKTVKEHDMLMSDLFKAQRLIRSNNTADALSMLRKLEKEHKDFSIISELKGIAYYMRKDLNNALSMFREAFSKNSKNIDAYKMKTYLEKRLGLDSEGR